MTLILQEISVEDSGIGIKKENIDKLFTKFERFDEKNTTIEGTGLGLAITKKLINLMNGKIVVQSIYGKGSKFTIIIDQKITNKTSIETVKKQESIVKVDLSSKKLLLVDDMMPKVSGVETLQKLRNIDGFNTPVVILTANAITGMKDKYLADGFDDYLSKPIEKNELNRVIEKFLNK